jgi:hypothetical protein
MVRKRIFRVAAAFLMIGIAAVGTQTPAQAGTASAFYDVYTGVQSGRCIDNPNNSTVNGTVMDIYNCIYHAQNEEWFDVTSSVAGWVSIKNVQSQKCLTVLNASTANYTSIIQYTCNGGDNQLWRSEDGYSDGTHIWPEFRNYNSRLCLTVKGALVANNTPLQQYSCNKGSNQAFNVSQTAEG